MRKHDVLRMFASDIAIELGTPPDKHQAEEIEDLITVYENLLQKAG